MTAFLSFRSLTYSLYRSSLGRRWQDESQEGRTTYPSTDVACLDLRIGDSFSICNLWEHFLDRLGLDAHNNRTVAEIPSP